MPVTVSLLHCAKLAWLIPVAFMICLHFLHDHFTLIDLSDPVWTGVTILVRKCQWAEVFQYDNTSKALICERQMKNWLVHAMKVDGQKKKHPQPSMYPNLLSAGYCQRKEKQAMWYREQELGLIPSSSNSSVWKGLTGDIKEATALISSWRNGAISNELHKFVIIFLISLPGRPSFFSLSHTGSLSS